MSYARWGQDGSHVYVFATTLGGRDAIECCACSLLHDPYGGWPEWFYDTESAVAHMQEHRDAGHIVPAGIEAEMRADDERNFPHGERP